MMASMKTSFEKEKAKSKLVIPNGIQSMQMEINPREFLHLVFDEDSAILDAPGKSLFISNVIHTPRKPRRRGGEVVVIRCKNLIVSKECSFRNVTKFSVDCDNSFVNFGKIEGEVEEISVIVRGKFRNFGGLSAERIGIDCGMFENDGVLRTCGSVIVSCGKDVVSRGLITSRNQMTVIGKRVIVEKGTMLGVKESRFFCSELRIETPHFYHTRLIVSGNLKTKNPVCKRIVVGKSGGVKCGEFRCQVRRFTNEGVVTVDKLFTLDNCEVFSNIGSVTNQEEDFDRKGGDLVLIFRTVKFFNRGSVCSGVLQVVGDSVRNRKQGYIFCRDRFSLGKNTGSSSKAQVLKEFVNAGRIEGGNQILVLARVITNFGNVKGLTMSFGSDFEDSTTERKVRKLLNFETMKNSGCIGDKKLCNSISFFGNSLINHGTIKSQESIQINLNGSFCSTILRKRIGSNIQGVLSAENTMTSRMISLYSPFVLTYGSKVYCNRYNEASLFSLKGVSLNVVNLRNVMSIVSLDLAKLGVPNIKQLIRTFLNVPELVEDICINDIGITLNVALNFFLDILQTIVVSNPQYVLMVGLLRAGFNALCFLPSTFANVYDLVVNVKTLPVYRIVAYLSSFGVYGKMVGFSIVEGFSAKRISDGLRNNGVMSVIAARKVLTQNTFGSVRGVLSYLNNETSISCLSIEGLCAGVSANSFKMSAMPLDVGSLRLGLSKRTLCLSSFSGSSIDVNWNQGDSSLTKGNFGCNSLSWNLSLDSFVMCSLNENKVSYGGNMNSKYYIAGKTNFRLVNVQCVGKSWKIGKGSSWELNSCFAMVDNFENNGSIIIPSKQIFQVCGHLIGNGTVQGSGVFVQKGDLGCDIEGKLQIVHDGKILRRIRGRADEYTCSSTCSEEYFFDLLHSTGVFSNFVVGRRIGVHYIGELIVTGDLHGRIFEKIGPGVSPFDGVNVTLSATEGVVLNSEQHNLGYSLWIKSSNGSIVVNKEVCCEGNIIVLSETENVIRNNDLSSNCGSIYVIAPNGIDSVVLKDINNCKDYVEAHVTSVFLRKHKECKGVQSLLTTRVFDKENNEFVPLQNGRSNKGKSVGNFVKSRSSYGYLKRENKKGDNGTIGKIKDARPVDDFSFHFDIDRMMLSEKENSLVNSSLVAEALESLLAVTGHCSDELDLRDLRTGMENREDVILGVQRADIDRSVKIVCTFGEIHEEIGALVAQNASYICPNGQISLIAKDYFLCLIVVQKGSTRVDNWDVERALFTQGKLISGRIHLECLEGDIFFCMNVMANEFALKAKGNIVLSNELDCQSEKRVKKRFFGLFREKTTVERKVESCVVHYVNEYSIDCEDDVVALGICFFDVLGENKEADDTARSSFVVKAGGNVVFERRKLATKIFESSVGIGLDLPFMSLNENGKLRPTVVSFLDRIKREVDMLKDPVQRILKHGTTINRVMESLFSIAHRFDWKSGNLRLYNHIVRAKQYFDNLKSGNFEFTLGISVNHSDVETVVEFLGMGSICLSHLKIESPGDVVIRNNYSVDVFGCSIDSNRLFFDSADLKSKVVEHSAKVGVGFLYTLSSGNPAKRTSFGWEVSGELSKEATVSHIPSVFNVTDQFHLDVDTCVLESVTLKCQKLTGRVEKLELSTLQKTLRKVEGRVSISGVGFSADCDIELSRKNDAVTAIVCDEFHDFSVGKLFVDEKSGVKTVSGDEIDLRLFADSVWSRERKESDHGMSMEFVLNWENDGTLHRMTRNNEGTVVGNEGMEFTELRTPLQNTSTGNFVGDIEGNMMNNHPMTQLELGSVGVNETSTMASIVSFGDTERGKIESECPESSEELLSSLGVLAKPRNLFLLIDPETLCNLQAMKDYWTGNFEYMGSIALNPYGKLVKPFGRWLKSRYFAGHVNHKNHIALTSSSISVPTDSFISMGHGTKVAEGIRATSWEDSKASFREYGNMVFTPQYGDLFLNIVPLVGFAKVSLELLSGKSSVSRERISVGHHLALLAMHGTGQLYWSRCSTQPIKNMKIPLKNGSFVRLNGYMDQRLFRFGKNTFQEVNIGSKWKLGDLNGRIRLRGRRNVVNSQWETKWDMVKDLEKGAKPKLLQESIPTQKLSPLVRNQRMSPNRAAVGNINTTTNQINSGKGNVVVFENVRRIAELKENGNLSLMTDQIPILSARKMALVPRTKYCRLFKSLNLSLFQSSRSNSINPAQLANTFGADRVSRHTSTEGKQDNSGVKKLASNEKLEEWSKKKWSREYRISKPPKELFIIDVNNMLYVTKPFRDQKPWTKRGATVVGLTIQKLVDLFRVGGGNRLVETIVVYDMYDTKYKEFFERETGSSEVFSAVKLNFKDADDMIVDLVKKKRSLKYDVNVVTSDRELQGRVLNEGCSKDNIIGSKAFLTEFFPFGSKFFEKEIEKVKRMVDSAKNELEEHAPSWFITYDPKETTMLLGKEKNLRTLKADSSQRKRSLHTRGSQSSSTSTPGGPSPSQRKTLQAGAPKGKILRAGSPQRKGGLQAKRTTQRKTLQAGPSQGRSVQNARSTQMGSRNRSGWTPKYLEGTPEIFHLPEVLIEGKKVSGKRNHERWTPEENVVFRKACREVFENNFLALNDHKMSFWIWESISRRYFTSGKVVVKTPEQCKRKFGVIQTMKLKKEGNPKNLLNPKPKNRVVWTREAFALLLKGVSIHGRSWKRVQESVAQQNPNASTGSCLGKFGYEFDWCLDDPILNEDKWGVKDTAKLFLELDFNGTSMSNAAKLVGKSTQQCEFLYDLFVNKRRERLLAKHGHHTVFAPEQDRIILDVYETKHKKMNWESMYKEIRKRCSAIGVPLTTLKKIEVQTRYHNLFQRMKTFKYGQFSLKEKVIAMVVRSIVLKTPVRSDLLIKKHLPGRNATQIRKLVKSLDPKFVKAVNPIRVKKLFVEKGNFDFLSGYLKEEVPKGYHDAQFVTNRKIRGIELKEKIIVAVVRQFVDVKSFTDVSKYVEGRDSQQCRNISLCTPKDLTKSINMSQISKLFRTNGSFDFLDKQYVNKKVPRRFHDKFTYNGRNKQWSFEQDLKLATLFLRIEDTMQAVVNHFPGMTISQGRRRMTYLRKLFNIEQELPVGEIHRLFLETGKSWDFFPLFATKWLSKSPGSIDVRNTAVKNANDNEIHVVNKGDLCSEKLGKRRVLYLDGAVGTYIMEKHGCKLHEDLWTALLLETEDGVNMVKGIHRDYLDIGCDVVTTCSYQIAESKVYKTFGSEEKQRIYIIGFTETKMRSLLKKSIDVAKEAVNENGTLQPFIKQKKRIAVSLSCIGASIPIKQSKKPQEFSGSYVNQMKNEDIEDFHSNRIEEAVACDVDILLFETYPALKEVEIICEHIQRVYSKQIESQTFPMVFVSFTCCSGEKTWGGDLLVDCAKSLDRYPFVLGIGVNCTNPKYVVENLEKLKNETDKWLLCFPNNSGLAREEVGYATNGSLVDWGSFAQELCCCFKTGLVLGGCCHTTPGDILSMRKRLINSIDE